MSSVSSVSSVVSVRCSGYPMCLSLMLDPADLARFVNETEMSWKKEVVCYGQVYDGKSRTAQTGCVCMCVYVSVV